MVRQRLGVPLGAQLVEEPRRSFDVAEEKRDSSGRKLPAHPSISSVDEGHEPGRTRVEYSTYSGN
jgi:hypothetical protein